jgi:DNA modification methylase
MSQTWRVLVGDVREKLRELPDGCVQTCVTSPPYWGLRDYGTASWEGGDAECDHVEMAVGMSDRNTLGPDGYLPPTNAANVGRARQFKRDCGKCGAIRIDSQIGLEPSPDEFCEALVQVFRDVRRVLKDDGTLWMNLGDSYLAQQGSGFNGQKRLDHANLNVKVKRPANVKPKDLVGIPWLVAFALRNDGWYLRSDIIWHKPNPMPESITDRPTKSHEYVFLLAKSPRYYYDSEAISELSVDPESLRGRNKRNDDQFCQSDPSGKARTRVGFAKIEPGTIYETRNARSVWTITTQPYPEAHFATFPEELPTRCIRAGSRPGDLVLDPFNGSGTTGAVALKLGRSYIGVELNPAYVELARRRIGGANPLFASEVA